MDLPVFEEGKMYKIKDKASIMKQKIDERLEEIQFLKDGLHVLSKCK